MQSPCGNKVSTQNFVSGSLLSIRVSPSMTARVVFFKRYAPFMIFAHKRLCAVLFVGGTKVPHECYPRHTRRIRRCYAAIFCMMLISFRSAYGSSFYNYKAKEKDPHRKGADQNLLYAAPSSGFTDCRTDRKDWCFARGSLQSLSHPI